MEKEKVIDLLCERVFMDDNDPAIDKVWSEITKLLSENAQETISFLLDCTEQQLFYISEVIEDVSYNLKSQEYIDTLLFLNNKYPQLHMEEDIRIAKDYMEES